MAVYGALVSVMHIVDQLHHHPRPPISLDKNQSESLTANVTFLQEFLEGYNPHVSYSAKADPLESRIAKAAYAAEDVIESYIVDQIYARSSDHVEEISSTEFYQGLQKVIEEMDVIKMEIKETKMKEKKTGVRIIKRQSTTDAGSSRYSSTAREVAMVGFDDVFHQMLDKITGGERVCQVIPIVGMGGLGKTTLARNIYTNPLVMEHFDICVWFTISQVHNAQKILSEILVQIDEDDGGDMSEYELRVKLFQHLMGKRYLIVMDDMWSIEAWDVVRSFFPTNKTGSRVVVTTRLSNFAFRFNYFDSLDLKFLDRASSWNLLCKTVFGKEICPLELEDIGKNIVKGCRGLPLSIVVVGGLLLKSEATPENWEVILDDLHSIVDSEDGGSCLQILYMGYYNLPVHIKPCFLYLGVFSEDEEILVCLLIQLMVAEGFVKSFDGKSLEEAAEDCIQELVDRNLVLVEERGDCGQVISLKMHDLVRDLILREGKKDKFFCGLMQSSDHWKISLSTQRRIATSFDEEYPPNPLLESLEPTSSLVRSLIGKFPETFSISSFRLLRVCMVDSDSIEKEESSDDHYKEIFIRLVNLRLIMVDAEELPLSRILSGASFLWNLQTLLLMREREIYVLDIWKMPLLRHVTTAPNTALCLPDPPPNEVVLENLHTLFLVRNLKLSEEVLKRIPNIRILRLYYDEISRTGEELGDDFCLNNLCRLHKLQFLQITSSPLIVHQYTLTFPYSLKELTLQGTMLPWEEMETKIGCLPLLQVLKLEDKSFIGPKWETVEGQFSSLKVLLIARCRDLEYWITDSTHFPRLELLFLHLLFDLTEIPSSIGEIPTLRSITLLNCSDSADESAHRIRGEQEECGNELLQIKVIQY